VRQDPEYFGEQELNLLYVAKRLKEALNLEQVLTDAGLDYLVEPDKYHGGVVFRTERVGAFFYVAPSSESIARQALERAGFRPFSAE
jgi:hypothetical protein